MSGFRTNNRTGNLEYNNIPVVDGSIPAEDLVNETGSDGTIIQRGSTLTRPLTPPIGTLRYNTDTNIYEGFFVDGWAEIFSNATGSGVILPTQPTTVILVSQEPNVGQFTSIAAAMDSIVDASPTKPYVIRIDVGRYTEPQIIMKPFVGIHGIGDAAAVTILPVEPSVDLVVATNYTWIENLSISSVTGATGLSFTSEIASVGFGALRMYNVRFLGNHTDMRLYTDDTHPAYAILHDLHFVIADANQHRCLFVEGGGAELRILGFDLDVINLSGPNLDAAFIVTGTNAELNVQGLAFGTVGLNSPGDGIAVIDGGIARVASAIIWGFNKNIVSRNAGVPPTLYISSCMSMQSSLHDISIEHPGTLGMFTGTAAVARSYIDPFNTTFVTTFVDGETGAQTITGALRIGTSIANATDVTDLIQQGGPVGAMDGGELTSTGPSFELHVEEGFGYAVDPSTRRGKRVIWNPADLTLPANDNVYVYVMHNGTVTFDQTRPDEETAILLGRVRTGPITIVTIAPIIRDARFLATHLDTYLRDVLGPIFISGCIVSEGSVARSVNVSSGEYWYSRIRTTPSGGSTIAYRTFYHSSGSFVQGADAFVVDNTMYDNGSDLVALDPGHFVKHSFHVIGQGVNEVYALVYGRDQWATLQEAQTAPLPSRPASFTDISVPIAAIIVEENGTSLADIIDIRPRIGFQAPSLSVVTDHGDLTGLGDNDHPQYLLRSGAQAMAGNLSMGTNNITNVGTVNGVTIQTHATRHTPTGVDPLPTAAPTAALTPASTNATGIQNSFSRSDHSHAVTGFQVEEQHLTALSNLSTLGLYTVIAPGSSVTRSFAVAGEGLQISNADGLTGNPTLSLSGDVSAVEALTTNGFAVRSTTNVWNTRSITGTAGRIAVANGDGTAANPSIDLASGVATPGTYRSVSVDTYGRVTAGTNPTTLGGYGITDAASNSATFVTINSEGSLGDSRSLSGTASQISLTDNGGGSTVSVGIASNPVLPGTTHVVVPTGTTLQETGTTDGALRYNTTSQTMRQRSGGNWIDVGTVTSVDITSPASGILATGGPVTTSGSITLTLSHDLAAVENLNTTGLTARTATDVWATRSIVAPVAGGLSITNGDGVAGDPTLVLIDDLAAVEGLTTNGMVARTTTNAWTTRTLTAPAAGLTITNPAGVAGNPTFALANDLAALEALSTNGIAARIAADSWTVRAIQQPASGITVTNGDGVAGNPSIGLANDLAAVEGLGTTGLTVRTAVDSWTTRTLTPPAAGLNITNGDGVSGNPTFALANDTAAIEALATSGIAVRTGTDTWATRTLTGPAAGVTVSNGDGIGGNLTINLVNDLAAIENIAATGMAARTGTDAWAVRTITAPASGISVSNGDGVAGNPTLSLTEDLLAVESLAGTGFAVRTAADTWNTRTIVGTANQILLTSGDGVSGNPTVALVSNPIIPGTASITIPVGTTAQRPVSPTTGMMRYNTSENIVEAYASPYGLFATPAALQFATELYSKRTVWVDDFTTGSAADSAVGLIGELNWSSTSLGGGTAVNAQQAAETNHPGILRLITGGAGANDSAIHMVPSTTGSVIMANQVEYMAWVVRIQTTTAYNFQCGLGQDVGNDGTFGTAGVFFVSASATAGGAWQFITRSGSTSTTVTIAGGAAVAGTWYLLEAFYDGTTWTPVVNGVAGTSSTTNIPTVALNVGALVTATGGAARSADIDLFSMMTREMGARY